MLNVTWNLCKIAMMTWIGEAMVDPRFSFKGANPNMKLDFVSYPGFSCGFWRQTILKASFRGRPKFDRVTAPISLCGYTPADKVNDLVSIVLEMMQMKKSYSSYRTIFYFYPLWSIWIGAVVIARPGEIHGGPGSQCALPQEYVHRRKFFLALLHHHDKIPSLWRSKKGSQYKQWIACSLQQIPIPNTPKHSLETQST